MNQQLLKGVNATWLVTGAAGFIGSNLVEELLRGGQKVVGLDNFSTGFRRNLDQVREAVGDSAWGNLKFIEGDIRSPENCREVVRDVDFVLHQAALGSVPRSLDNPLATHESNATGFLNMLIAARDASVKRFVYAASSSTYGDHQDLPKVEHKIGAPLSPYAVTKYLNELYADVFSRSYGLNARGLRYFNVFGPRQDPRGAYAAVIPIWIASLIRGERVLINGDGETSRDFCFVSNAVQANLRAALAEGVGHEVYNVAVGERTTLNELFGILKDLVSEHDPSVRNATPSYRDFRPGDVRHSQASVDKAHRDLGYTASHRILEGLKEAMPWYLKHVAPSDD